LKKKKEEKRMVMQTSPIGVDGYKDKVVAVDFWFFLFVQVCVSFFRIYASIGSKSSNLKKPLILSSSNDVVLKLTSLTALL